MVVKVYLLYHYYSTLGRNSPSPSRGGRGWGWGPVYTLNSSVTFSSNAKGDGFHFPPSLTPAVIAPIF
jgi:hypothetical protein